MKKLLPVLMLSALTCMQTQGRALSQTPEQTLEECLDEGRLLYRLWWTESLGRDVLFRELGEDTARRTWRQLAYQNERGQYVLMLWEEDEEHSDNPEGVRIAARVVFDNLSGHKGVPADTLDNTPTSQELSLIEMYRDVDGRTVHDEERIFKNNEDASYRYFPVIYGGRRTVYAYSYIRRQGVINSVMFGGDYRLIYDENNKLAKWDNLHASPIELPEPSSGDVSARIDSLLSVIPPQWSITPVDVMTILRYGDVADYKTEYAKGNPLFYPRYVSEREEMIIKTIRVCLNFSVEGFLHTSN